MTEQGTGFGARLRGAREQAGLSLRQIADATKLSVRSLEALEVERVARLPEGIYRRAIVRAYAREVGLNPEVIVREFLALYPDDLPPLAPLPTHTASPYDVAPAPEEKQRQRPWRAVLSLVGTLVPVLAGVVYFALGTRSGDRPQRMVQMMPPRPADVWAPDIVPAGGFIEAPPMLGRPVSVMITVSSRCALEVVADGRQIIARKLEPGEKVRLNLSREVVLSGDDAGAVNFSINGRVGRRLGAIGSPLNVRIAREDYDAWLQQP